MNRLHRRLPEWLCEGERGQATVETTLSLLLVVTTAFWLFELSSFAYTYSVLNNAVQEGVRYAVVHGTDSDSCSGPSSGCRDSTGANVVAVVKNFAGMSLHNMSNMTVTVSYPESTGCAPPSLVIVTLHYTYVPYLSFPGLKKAVSFQAQGRIVF